MPIQEPITVSKMDRMVTLNNIVNNILALKPSFGSINFCTSLLTMGFATSVTNKMTQIHINGITCRVSK